MMEEGGGKGREGISGCGDFEEAVEAEGAFGDGGAGALGGQGDAPAPAGTAAADAELQGAGREVPGKGDAEGLGLAFVEG